nr:MAG TPA: hypothetical protein [Caudoviricetes sp.]
MEGNGVIKHPVRKRTKRPKKSNQSVLGHLPYTYRRSLYTLIVISYS